MTELQKYKAGKALLEVLKQHDLAPAVIKRISSLVVELLDEERSSAPLVQQQQQQQPASSTHHLQDADAVLQGLTLLHPRGKFDCGFFGDCIQFTNKQTSAQVPYGNIQHVLIIDAIPKQPNQTYMVLVMKKGQPVRQGKNTLDLVVLQTKDQPELSIPAPEACQHLGSQLEGAAAVVLSQLLASYIEGVSEDTFLTADSAVFSSSAGDLMVSANKGVQPGWLVPLSAGLCWVGKQGCFMPHQDISRVVLHRTGGGSATFDILIKLYGASKPLELGQIDTAELPKLQVYCSKQRIRVGGDDDDSDDEAAAGAAGAATGAAGGGPHGGEGDDDDDDEEDEDFDPDAAGQPATKKQRVDRPGVQDEDDCEPGSEGEEDEEDAEFGSDLSSDPDLVPSGELSGMEEDDLGDYE